MFRRNFLKNGILGGLLGIFGIGSKVVASEPEEVVMFDGDTKLIFVDQKLVRKMYPNGCVEWWKNGRLHRDDGPAITVNGEPHSWHKEGRLHREDGPALTVNGSEKWCLHGKRHREGGPAVTHPDGTLMWYKDGLLHREDGPAVTYPDGLQKWYNNGRYVKTTFSA